MAYSLRGGGALSSNAHSDWAVGNNCHSEALAEESQNRHNFTNIALLRAIALWMTVFRHVEAHEQRMKASAYPFKASAEAAETLQSRCYAKEILRLKPQNDCKMRGEVSRESRKVAFTLAEGATHVAHSNNLHKAAFTLAEVLITLGIIGVVVALTIPNVVTIYKKKVVATRLAKIYSVLNQALVTSEEQNGACTTWDYGDKNNHRNSEIMQNWWETYMADFVPNIATVKKTSTSTTTVSGNGSYMVFFKDGTALKIEAIPGSYLWVIVFINTGTDISKFKTTSAYYYALSNKLLPGRDFFSLYLFPDKKCAFASSYDSSFNYSREQLIENCKDFSSLGDACLKLIKDNGWKIPDDYPVRF